MKLKVSAEWVEDGRPGGEWVPGECSQKPSHNTFRCQCDIPSDLFQKSRIDVNRDEQFTEGDISES